MGCRRLATVVGALLALAARAEAQPPASERDPAAAEALFEQGRRALEKNDLSSACSKFEESQRLDPGVGTLMNLANCQERQGRIASAWQHWREALRQLADDDDRSAFARQHVEALEPKLPRLSITLAPGAPSGTRVFRDGVVLGAASLGTPLPVDPGERSIAVSAPGFASRGYRIAVAEGEARNLEVAPGDRLLPAARADAPAASASGRRVAGWVLIGAGAAGVLTGVVTGLMLPGRQREVDANCTAAGCNEAGMDAAAEGKRLIVLNTAGWLVGFAGLGAGGYLVLSRPAASPHGFAVGYGSSF